MRHFDRLSGLTNDVRNLYRPFVRPVFLTLDYQRTLCLVRFASRSVNHV